MPFCGTMNPVSPGTTQVFSLTTTPDLQLPTPDSLISATSVISVAAPMIGGPQYTGKDPNAAALVIGPAILQGNTILQTIGGPAGARTGFQPNVMYIWAAYAQTKQGKSLVYYAHLPCLPIS